MPGGPSLLQARSDERRHEPMQDDSAASLACLLDQPQLQEAIQCTGEPTCPVCLFRGNIGTELQQGAWDRETRCQPSSAGEDLAGQGVDLIVGPQAAQADLEGASHIPLVASER